MNLVGDKITEKILAALSAQKEGVQCNVIAKLVNESNPTTARVLNNLVRLNRVHCRYIRVPGKWKLVSFYESCNLHQTIS